MFELVPLTTIACFIKLYSICLQHYNILGGFHSYHVQLFTTAHFSRLSFPLTLVLEQSRVGQLVMNISVTFHLRLNIYLIYGEARART